jgi:predicted DNA-binding transcriptional regulator AlpA
MQPFVTKKQLAAALHVTERCVDLWVRRKLLPAPMKLGGTRRQNRVRWRYRAIEAAIDRLAKATGDLLAPGITESIDHQAVARPTTEMAGPTTNSEIESGRIGARGISSERR